MKLPSLTSNVTFPQHHHPLFKRFHQNPLPAAFAVFKPQMKSCFFHTLSELDPQYSNQLAARPRSYRATMSQQLLKRFGITGEESEDMRLVSSSHWVE